jgi:triacylglycerol esterase/lipase EstA (alpha/beta hydrolase family)
MAICARSILIGICLVGVAKTGSFSRSADLSAVVSHYERPASPKGPFKQRVIVFVHVHGIFGDADDSWRYSPNVYWPKLLLADSAFDDTDVYIASYASPYHGNTMTVDEVVNSLNSRLTADDVFSKTREVIFVCHSLGGIILQRLLLTHREYARQVPFIYFFATPETGSQLAKLAGIFSSDPLLQAMFPGDSNAYLQNLENEWKAAHLGIRRYCAYEKSLYMGFWSSIV